MNLAVVVLRKELTDHLRDHRSLAAALIAPLLGPLLLLFVFHTVTKKVAPQELEVPVVGAEHAPSLIAHIRANGATVKEAPASPEDAVRAGDLNVVLVIDDDFPSALVEPRRARVKLLVDDGNQNARRDVVTLRAIIRDYSATIGAQRLLVRGVDPTITNVVEADEVNVGPEERSGIMILGLIPFFLVLMIFSGGISISIDSTAGERERRSLEGLLLNPVRPSHFILGKWLAASCFGLWIGALGVIGFVAAVSFADLSQLPFRVAFGAAQGAQIFVLLAPLAFLGAAMQMFVATFARSYKEAQLYVSLLALAPELPAGYLMIEPETSATWKMLIPALGQVSATTDLIGGDAVPPLHFALIWLSTAVCVAVVLAAQTRLLRREKIVFGT